VKIDDAHLVMMIRQLSMVTELLSANTMTVAVYVPHSSLLLMIIIWQLKLQQRHVVQYVSYGSSVGIHSLCADAGLGFLAQE
jgi:hypothetical protein